MKKLILLFLILCMTSGCPVWAQVTYTGKAENVKAFRRGIEFDAVIKDENGNIIFNQKQWIPSKVIAEDKAASAIQNIVTRLTQDMYAHKEGAKFIEDSKVLLEKYSISDGKFNGKIENLITTDLGAKFDVVVNDDKSIEVLRLPLYVSTGTVTGEEAKTQIQNLVIQYTQGVSRAQSAKNALIDYQASCSQFVPSTQRANVEDEISQ